MREAKENNVSLKDYSDLLFDCIDTSQTDAAMFLIENGADPEVWARVSGNMTSQINLEVPKAAINVRWNNYSSRILSSQITFKAQS